MRTPSFVAQLRNTSRPPPQVRYSVREKLPPIVLELFAFSGAAASLGIARARGEARRAPPLRFLERCLLPK